MTQAPRFSVVLPVDASRLDALAETIESLRLQTFGDWEAIVVDASGDGEPPSHGDDPRIRVIRASRPGHLAEQMAQAANEGLAVARGEFVSFLDCDGRLERDALARVNRAARPGVDFLYTDSADLPGTMTSSESLKPQWDPERLRSHDYIGQLAVIRRSLAQEIGGFRPEFAGAEQHDLYLRATERATRIKRIPRILYTRREIRAAVETDAGRRAVQEQLSRLGLNGTVECDLPGTYRIRRHLDPTAGVSIVIPTMGKTSRVWGRERVHVVEAVESMLAKTSHRNLEFVVVYDAPTPPAVIDELSRLLGQRLVLMPYEAQFNFSHKVNLGVLASSGDFIVIVNDDVEVISDDWLDAFLGPLDDPAVGVVGARLLYPDMTIQHVGHIYNAARGYKHAHRGALHVSDGPLLDLKVTRQVAGVTGACIGLRRTTFLELGGLDEDLPQNFNDVDFCYKARHLGYRVVYTPHCELFHFETVSRDAGLIPNDFLVVQERWPLTQNDPFTRVG